MNCSNCGSPVVITPQFCPECGNPVAQGANLCTNCGHKIAQAQTAQAQPSASYSAPLSQTKGITLDSSGEVVLKDTGFFPITYVKSLMSSTNGKLTLTNQRLIFKASALQGVGGVSTEGIFIPNPKDAEKAKEHFAIPLAEITSVENGWASLTIEAYWGKAQVWRHEGYKELGGSREKRNDCVWMMR